MRVLSQDLWLTSEQLIELTELGRILRDASMLEVVQGTLIFDGDCGFCTTSAHWIEQRWPAGSAQAIPWQRLHVDRLAEFGLTIDDVRDRAWWADALGVRGGERAVVAALKAAGGVWGLVGLLLDAPPLNWLAGPGYQIVARNRSKLPGGTPACRN